MHSPYFQAFGLTLAVEVPVYLVVLTTAAGVGWRRALGAAVAVNVVTHPVLWWAVREYPRGFLIGEIVVCVVEWGLLCRWTRRPRSDWLVLAAASVAANSASVLAGLLLLG